MSAVLSVFRREFASYFATPLAAVFLVIFLALAGHPEISQLSSASPADHEDTSRQFAALFMRLVTVDCATEMRALAQAGGPEAMKLPFEHLGQIAMQELMNHPNVAGNIAGFELDFRI